MISQYTYINNVYIQMYESLDLDFKYLFFHLNSLINDLKLLHPRSN